MQIHSNIVHDAHQEPLRSTWTAPAVNMTQTVMKVSVYHQKKLNEEYNGHMAHVVMGCNL